MLAAAGCSSGKKSSDPLVAELSISNVSLYQGLESPLVIAGAPPTDATKVPVVANRAGLLRVLVNASDAWTSRPIVARLSLTQGTTALPDMEQTFTPTASSTQGDLASSINFALPAETVTTDLTWSLSLHESDPKLAQKGDTSGAVYPAVEKGAADQVALGATETGIVKVTIIPIVYTADGSGRVPETSDAALAGFRSKMMQLYPVTDVQITVGAQLNYTRTVGADGTGWDRLLNTIIQKRATDGVAPDVYYYGLFAPSASFDAYCAQGCVTGLSPLADDPMDDTSRASLGVGYADAESDITFVHEVGHAHGRAHAPCGNPAQPDPDYPYTDAEIGSWGYDDSSQKLLDPTGIPRDMMAYCDNVWISDYNYKALYDRVRIVDNAPYRVEVPARWHTLLIATDGSITRGGSFTSRRPPIGTPRNITRTLGGVTDTIVGHFYAYDHLAGGTLIVAESDDLGALRFEGRAVTE